MSESVAWQNWSGSQRHSAAVAAPATLPELQGLLQQAAERRLQVRCVGSAHSFVPFWTDDLIIGLDAFSGLVAVDPEHCTATVAAGTKLHQLGPLLWEAGLSLPQQGDIDRQSLAGALATGTHGTGRALPSLPNYVRELELLTAAGDRLALSADRHPDWFAAALVSQGTLGVVVSATLALEPAFQLRERTWECSYAECEASLAELIDHNRHCEFFWTPRTDRCEVKTLNKSTEAPPAAGERVGPAYRIFPSDRELRFNEMEYSVPFAQGWPCFVALRAMLLRDFPKLPWPIEFRTLAADALPLSTACGRETVTLSVHQGAERDHRPLFDAAEAIFRDFDGRPHWGKLHSLTAPDLTRLYPRFAEFRQIRETLDPHGRFLNPYLTRLLVG